jgi:hypothetical protein
MDFGTGLARALNDRLEIAGQQSSGLPETRDAHRLKIPLEEGSSGLRIPQPQAIGFAADVPQGAVDVSAVLGAPHPSHRLAAALIGCEGGEVIVGRPTRERGPLERLELAVRELQRIIGLRSVRRQSRRA